MVHLGKSSEIKTMHLCHVIPMEIEEAVCPQMNKQTLVVSQIAYLSAALDHQRVQVFFYS